MHPRPPSAADLYPNASPYPIATTAIGVLSRAKSRMGGSTTTSRRRLRARAACFEAGNEGSENDGKDSNSTGKGREERRRAEYRGHRYSRSLSSSEDMYLPSAPSSNANGEYTGGSGNAAAVGSYSAYATSGTSPKRWTSAQLATHVNTTAVPRAGAWATTRNVGERAFMRMGEMEEQKLRGCASLALRPAAHALRHDVLASSSSTSLSLSSCVFDDEVTNTSAFRRGGSTSPTRPRVAAVYEEPGEIEDGELDVDAHDAQDNWTPSHLELEPIVLLQRRQNTSTNSHRSPLDMDTPPTLTTGGRGRARARVRARRAASATGV
ncbi:hypothetical protein K438DRAFT_2021573 [Mycena galopus ATCC 62051]|nr:hypothetical protein K438DRAFT_2021573 [Mycena galopus ATCC 62051]